MQGCHMSCHRSTKTQAVDVFDQHHVTSHACLASRVCAQGKYICCLLPRLFSAHQRQLYSDTG
jgi:hypothetical protein